MPSSFQDSVISLKPSSFQDSAFSLKPSSLQDSVNKSSLRTLLLSVSRQLDLRHR